MKILGLAGGAASGKTTLAKALVEELDSAATLLSLDDFFLTDRRHGPFISVNGRPHFDLNHPDAIDVPAVLQAIEHQCQRGADMLLVEGHLSLALPKLRHLMTLKVFLYLEDDLRLGRKIVRNFERRGIAPAITLQNYLNSGKPGHDAFVAPSMHEADLILSGAKPAVESARLLALLLRSL